MRVKKTTTMRTNVKTTRINLVIFVFNLILLSLWTSLVIVNIFEGSESKAVAKGEAPALEREVSQPLKEQDANDLYKLW